MADNIKVANVRDNAKNLIHEFKKYFKLATVACRPGKIRVFSINTVQNEYMTISTDADHKLESLNEHSPTRVGRKQSDEQKSDFEKPIFVFTKSSLGWIECAPSLFCSSYASC